MIYIDINSFFHFINNVRIHFIKNIYIISYDDFYYVLNNHISEKINRF